MRDVKRVNTGEAAPPQRSASAHPGEQMWVVPSASEEPARLDVKASGVSGVDLLLAKFDLLHEDDALRFLTAAMERRPNALGQLSSFYAEQGVKPHSFSQRDLGRSSSALHGADPASKSQELPRVHFLTPTLYCHESDGRVEITAVRTGNTKCRSEVRYRSEDVTSRKGEHYVEADGVLVFEVGEVVAKIEVKLVENDTWEATMDFYVELVPEGLVNARLAPTLRRTQVRIGEKFVFPTDKFRQEIESKQNRIGQYDIPPFLLFFEVFRALWAKSVIRKGMTKRFLMESYHNVQFLFYSLSNIYLVDRVLGKQHGDVSADTRNVMLLVLLSLMAANHGVMHYFDYSKLLLGVGGNIRTVLQLGLLTKFLDYSKDSRDLMREADLFMACTRDSIAFIVNGWYGVFKILRCIGKLLAIFIYIIAVAVFFDKPVEIQMVAPIVAYPILLAIYLWFRAVTIHAHTNNKINKQNGLIHIFQQVTSCTPLIDGYDARIEFIGKTQAAIKAFNGANRANNIVHTNDKYAAKWLTTLFVSMYIMVGGREVIHGRLALGVFLMDIKVLRSMGKAWSDAYKNALDLAAILPGLDHIVFLMNLQTDFEQRMNSNEVQMQRSVDAVTHQDQTLSSLRISMANVVVRNHLGPPTAVSLDRSPSKMFVGPVGTFEVAQGTLSCIVGPNGEGKSTLLRALGGDMVINPGSTTSLRLPAHLSVLHVPSEPLFVEGSLFNNLTFGCVPGSANMEMVRVIAICRRLGLSDAVIDHVTQTEARLKWSGVLSETQKHLVCLARALVRNPGMLCIHKPAQALGAEDARLVFKAIRLHVDDEGLEMPQVPGEKAAAWPRTCVVTLSRYEYIEAFDKVFQVSKEGIKDISEERHVVVRNNPRSGTGLGQ